MKLGKYAETYIIVYLNTDTDELVSVPSYGKDETALLNLLIYKGPKQKLKNIFKVDALGKVTLFKDLNLAHKGLINKIRELTKK